MNAATIEFLTTLEAVIASRRDSNASGSYTAQLFAAGLPRMAQKVGEEGVELAIAAVQDDDARVTSEAADLLYHLLVLLRARDLELADVVQELERRHR
jgi:phosphoribosyl-ATP pyrophosphohydrolase/phosphoribosyl-AMP cyclohydrolase